MSSNRYKELLRIRKLADFQFGRGTGETLFPENVEITISRKTKKIRYIYQNHTLLATLRPTNGFFSLSLAGARNLVKALGPKAPILEISEEASNFIRRGGDVFAKHVISVNEEIRSGEEIIVLSPLSEIVGVGRALLSGCEMKSFRRGIAVKIRKGTIEKNKCKKKNSCIEGNKDA